MSKIANFKGRRNGFETNPQNINKDGRPVSIRTQIKEILKDNGTHTIPADQIKCINDDGSVTIRVPTESQIAMQLIEWSISDKGNTSLKAIQMLLDQIDGKPKPDPQSIEFHPTRLFLGDLEEIWL